MALTLVALTHDLGGDELDPSIENLTFPRRPVAASFPVRYPAVHETPKSSYHVPRFANNRTSGSTYTYSGHTCLWENASTTQPTGCT